jgi:hypothetical protein
MSGIDYAVHARRSIACLGEDWTATPVDEEAQPFTIRGVLRAQYGTVLEEGMSRGVAISQPRFITMFADLGDITVGATLSRGSVSWRVAWMPEKAELPSGRAVLELEKP